ncbi:Gfo/Idh/MocA family protein [Paenibacillus piri]|uniref:Gfo/Idh/MocA family oxidoreductase n=1 Tax=Paenibacillus piri TaxID=2547395 RepID=A0A4R5KD26_9BACL|nr:Gfo/Idh/MocA family oxidoreductase [Paenibacillus piri]TDF93181.1 Gfo/Idh/MocA family oxidoreductase [Paenibacillus piri]
MQLAIIGSTGHINYVMDGLRELPEVRLVGVSPGSEGEPIGKLTERAAREGHEPTVYADYRELLDKARPDVVAVACFFHDHAKIAAEALRRGIHVFVEKPVATSLDDLAMLREAYRNAGGAQLAAMFGIRYNPAFYTAWHAVRDGAVGGIRLMHAQKSYRLGSRGEHFKRRETYGGTIPWVGSHAIDWVHWFSGARFETVYASHSAMHNQGNGELEMSAACQFTMSGQIAATVSIDYLRPAAAPTHGDDRIRIAGTEGVLEVRGGQVLLINGEQEGERELPLLPKADIFADFVRQIAGTGTCLVSAEQSFYVTEACLKAVISADENRVVTF